MKAKEQTQAHSTNSLIIKSQHIRKDYWTAELFSGKLTYKAYIHYEPVHSLLSEVKPSGWDDFFFS